MTLIIHHFPPSNKAQSNFRLSQPALDMFEPLLHKAHGPSNGVNESEIDYEDMKELSSFEELSRGCDGGEEQRVNPGTQHPEHEVRRH